MRRLLPCLLLVACVQPVTQPTPEQMTTSRSPEAVFGAVARALVGQGFEISVSDRDAGLLTAKRARPGPSAVDLAKCNWAAGSLFDKNSVVTMTVSVTISATPSGSAALVAVRTSAAFPGLTGVLARPDADDMCTSNGTVERALASAIHGSATPGAAAP